MSGAIEVIAGIFRGGLTAGQIHDKLENELLPACPQVGMKIEPIITPTVSRFGGTLCPNHPGAFALRIVVAGVESRAVLSSERREGLLAALRDQVERRGWVNYLPDLSTL